MKFKLEEIFSPWVLLWINIAIVLAAEFLGDRQFFYETGLVHALAVFFIFLAFSRVLQHYYTYDPVLEKFVHASLAALIIFSASHLVEFLSYVVFNVHEDAIFANVINFYIISIILLVIGADSFLKTLKERSRLFIWIMGAVIGIFSLLVLANFANDELVSLEPLTLVFNFYVVAIAFFGILGVYWVRRIKKAVPATAGFVNYLTATVVVITLAGIQNLLYEPLEEIGIPAYQSVYISHFAFYAALSLMFLAYVKLHTLGGVYDDLRAAAETRNSTK